MKNNAVRKSIKHIILSLTITLLTPTASSAMNNMNITQNNRSKPYIKKIVTHSKNNTFNYSNTHSNLLNFQNYKNNQYFKTWYSCQSPFSTSMIVNQNTITNKSNRDPNFNVNSQFKVRKIKLPTGFISRNYTKMPYSSQTPTKYNNIQIIPIDFSSSKKDDIHNSPLNNIDKNYENNQTITMETLNADDNASNKKNNKIFFRQINDKNNKKNQLFGSSQKILNPTVIKTKGRIYNETSDENHQNNSKTENIKLNLDEEYYKLFSTKKYENDIEESENLFENYNFTEEDIYNNNITPGITYSEYCKENEPTILNSIIQSDDNPYNLQNPYIRNNKKLVNKNIFLENDSEQEQELNNQNINTDEYLKIINEYKYNNENINNELNYNGPQENNINIRFLENLNTYNQTNNELHEEYIEPLNKQYKNTTEGTPNNVSRINYPFPYQNERDLNKKLFNKVDNKQYKLIKNNKRSEKNEQNSGENTLSYDMPIINMPIITNFYDKSINTKEYGFQEPMQINFNISKMKQNTSRNTEIKNIFLENNSEQKQEFNNQNINTDESLKNINDEKYNNEVDDNNPEKVKLKATYLETLDTYNQTNNELHEEYIKPLNKQYKYTTEGTPNNVSRINYPFPYPYKKNLNQYKKNLNKKPFNRVNNRIRKISENIKRIEEKQNLTANTLCYNPPIETLSYPYEINQNTSRNTEIKNIILENNSEQEQEFNSQNINTNEFLRPINKNKYNNENINDKLNYNNFQKSKLRQPFIDISVCSETETDYPIHDNNEKFIRKNSPKVDNTLEKENKIENSSKDYVKNTNIENSSLHEKHSSVTNNSTLSIFQTFGKEKNSQKKIKSDIFSKIKPFKMTMDNNARNKNINFNGENIGKNMLEERFQNIEKFKKKNQDDDLTVNNITISKKIKYKKNLKKENENNSSQYTTKNSDDPTEFYKPIIYKQKTGSINSYDPSTYFFNQPINYNHNINNNNINQEGFSFNKFQNNNVNSNYNINRNEQSYKTRKTHNKLKEQIQKLAAKILASTKNENQQPKNEIYEQVDNDYVYKTRINIYDGMIVYEEEKRKIKQKPNFNVNYNNNLEESYKYNEEKLPANNSSDYVQDSAEKFKNSNNLINENVEDIKYSNNKIDKNKIFPRKNINKQFLQSSSYKGLKIIPKRSPSKKIDPKKLLRLRMPENVKLTFGNLK